MSIGYDQLSRNAYKILAHPFFEATGAVDVKDIAKPHHVTVQTNSPTWTQLPSGIWVLDFDSAIPEYLQISAAASADLNFVAQDFSVIWWMNADSIANNPRILNRGLVDTDGYDIQVLDTGALRVRTFQAADSQQSSNVAGSVVVGQYGCFGVSRIGASIRVFKNGIDTTSVVGTHQNPITANRKFLTGIYTDEVTTPYDGKLWNPRAWSGIAMTEYEHRLIFEMERKWFGV